MILFRSFLFINHIYTGQIFKYKNIFGGRLYKENNQKNCTIIHILSFYACLILNTFQVMLAVFIFLVVLLLMTIFFFKIFQDLNIKGGCWSMIDNWLGWSMM